MSNVHNFGAAGDGIQDDTEAIEHAIKDGDGFVEFPRGQYLISRTVRVPLANVGRQGLRGSGGTAKILMAGAGPAFELIGTHEKTADPGGFRPQEWEKERMPTIGDLEIEGRHAEADGIRIHGVMQATLTGVLIRKVRHGVHVTDRARNLLISHCHIYHNTGVGIFFEDLNLHQTNIVGCHISYNLQSGIRIMNSEIRNLQITGNDIEYNNFRAFGIPLDQSQPSAEIWIETGDNGSVREFTIASNTIQATYSPVGANIRFIGKPGGPNTKIGMGTIAGNIIGSQAINLQLSGCRGLAITGNHIYSGHARNLQAEDCQDITLSGNVFGHNPDYGDKELCTGIRMVDCSSCNLSGMIIQDALAGQNTVAEAIPVDRSALIELVRCQLMTLNGVQVLDGAPVGILLEDCRQSLVTGCTIVETRDKPLMTHAIRATGPGGGNVIAHCITNRPVDAPGVAQAPVPKA